jgi:hypothetical protein
MQSGRLILLFWRTIYELQGWRQTVFSETYVQVYHATEDTNLGLHFVIERCFDQSSNMLLLMIGLDKERWLASDLISEGRCARRSWLSTWV